MRPARFQAIGITWVLGHACDTDIWPRSRTAQRAGGAPGGHFDHLLHALKLSTPGGSLAATIEAEMGVVPALVEGASGVYDIVCDGQLVFSKHEAGRFPEEEEIVAALRV